MIPSSPSSGGTTRGIHHTRSTCRVCGSSALNRFLSLGPTPLANSFLADPSEFAVEERYPLDVAICSTCSLVQLENVIDPAVLFSDYIYVTGTSDTMAEHNTRYAATVMEDLALGPADLVVEVASNDGSLLRRFLTSGIRGVGVEPARNIAAMAEASGVPTLSAFWNAETADQILSSMGRARVVIGNNVLAHVDDAVGFLRAAEGVLTDDGRAVIEVPYLGDLLGRLEYDTIYHEHLSYFSVTSLMRLTEEAGFRIDRISRLPVHGGSLRMYAAPARSMPAHSEQVRAWAAQEAEAGLTSMERFNRFAADVTRHREALRALMGDLVGEGKSIGGYGAPAKANTLLNYCEIDTRWLPFTVDRSSLKVGKYTPGMHIPVLPTQAIAERRPDCVLILAWNFAEEILEFLAPFRRAGGKVILPVPTPEVQ